MPNHHAEILKFAFSWHQTQQTHDHARKIKINEIIYTHFSNYHHQRTIIISPQLDRHQIFLPVHPPVLDGEQA